MESSNVDNESSSDKYMQRRSMKMKNLVDVELILFEDESKDYEAGVKDFQSPSTSEGRQQQSRSKDVGTPKASDISVLTDLMQTPRRSCRKSVKPPQDYNDIVKASLRSAGKSSKSLLITLDEQENMVSTQTDIVPQQKWSTAVVGKSSSKRGRKSKKSTTAKNPKKKTDDVEVQEVHPESKKKLEMEFIGGTEMHEENVPKDETNTVAQEIPSMYEKDGDDHICEENIKAIERTESLNNEILRAASVVVIPESVIRPPKDRREGNEGGDTSVNTLTGVLKIEKETKNQASLDTDFTSDIRENCTDDIRPDAAECFDSIQLIKKDSDVLKNSVMATKRREPAVSVAACDNEDSSTDNFGSYLKSNKINVSDLGLIPLKDDDDIEPATDNINCTAVRQQSDAEEMPSLIILDDDDDDDKNGVGINNNKKEKSDQNKDQPKLNETFENLEEVIHETYLLKTIASISSESVNNSLQNFLNYEAAARVLDEEMGPLKMSDDEETPRKAPRIVLTTTNNKNHTILGTPKPSTPKQKATTSRFPTPHTKKILKTEKLSSSKKLPLTHTNMSLALTTMEPKKIVLRGIRKRSISMSIVGSSTNNAIDSGGVTKRQNVMRGPLATFRQHKAVNFYSPANQTTVIDDIDRIIADSVKKDKINRPVHQTTNVTTRRKRSLSLDESTMHNSLSYIPRPAGANVSSFSAFSSMSSTSTSTSNKPTRTKLPNFAAIHQKHFQKMENVVDHVARRQERSKILINSASKIKLASAQKNVSNNSKRGRLEQPKSLKKINLAGSSPMKSNSVLNHMATKPINSKVGIQILNNNSKENQSMIEISKLPHPRELSDPNILKFINRPQHLPSKQNLKSTKTTNVLASTKFNATTPIKPKQQKPFNLSTQIPVRSQVVKPSTSAAVTSFAESSSNVSSVLAKDKISTRQQRHREMFMSRSATTRSGGVTRKIEATIRGVRSNRRFELQMQHRNNLEK